MKRFYLALAILSFAPIASIAQRERDTTFQSARKKQATFTKDLPKNSFTPSAGSGLSNVISNISVVSSFNEGQNAKAELKYQWGWSTFGLAIDQKINKGTSTATPIDLINGLSSGTKIGLNAQFMHWRPKLSKFKRRKLDLLLTDYAKRNGEDRRTISSVNIEQNGTDQEKIRLKKIKSSQPVFFNIQPFFEKTSYTYSTDSIKLSTIESNYFTPSIIASLMIPNIRSNSFWILNYSYSQNYNAGSDITLSQPFGTTRNFVNQTATFGEPTKTISNKVSVEWRKGFKNEDGKISFAIDPSVLWNFTKNRLTITCPVYFIPGKDDKDKFVGLQGGFLLGWSSGGSFIDGIGAQVFLSAPFDIFKEVK